MARGSDYSTTNPSIGLKISKKNFLLFYDGGQAGGKNVAHTKYRIARLP